MDITGKKLVVIGGAGLIGSHTVDELLKEDFLSLSFTITSLVALIAILIMH